jgi:lysozyme family protein
LKKLAIFINDICGNSKGVKMSKFDECFEHLMRHEGGYVNDSKDPGGETKYGVSKRSYPNVDIKNLTLEDAKAIYRKDYWNANKVSQVPKDLQHIYFDMCVNMGKGRAVKVLQETANNKNKNKIDVDGGLGPMTRKAINRVEVERVRAFRVKYYVNLIDKKPALSKFFFGWFRRSLEV